MSGHGKRLSRRGLLGALTGAGAAAAVGAVGVVAVSRATGHGHDHDSGAGAGGARRKAEPTDGSVEEPAEGSAGRGAAPRGKGAGPVYLGSFGAGIGVGTYGPGRGAPNVGRTFDGGGDGGLSNPSFLALAPSGRVLYAVDEKPRGTVRALAIGKGGELSALGAVRSTGGDSPTHLAVHPGGRHLLTANYGSGSLAVHPIGPDGALGERTDLVRHTGSGPDPERQAGPHAHQVLPDPGGRFVLAADLGTDTVYGYRLDGRRGRLTRVSEVRMAAGSGPRHLAFHPGARFVYVLGELDSTITVAAYDERSGRLSLRDSQPTLPAGTDPGERNYPAEVVVSADGRFVYVSNRGHNSVARFAVTGGGAVLRLLDTVPCGGTYPRHISLSPSGRLLFAGNQTSNTVGVFRVDARTGELGAVSEPFAARSPVCVLPTPMTAEE